LCDVDARPAIIVDLCDAAAFMHGDRTRLWVTAETAVKCADHNPILIDQATRNLENALRREGTLDQQPVSLRRSSALHLQVHLVCCGHHVVVQICHDQK
jgi:hypothetical protein